MQIIIGLIFFGLGLLIGSFLNALIYRLSTGQSIVFDRSMCPHCKHTLEAWDLIPVFSFIFLRGKCRYCRKKISWQYPLVETVTAVSFLILTLRYGSEITDFSFWFGLIFICFMIVIAVFDFKHYLILDKVVFPAAVLAFLYLIIGSIKLGHLGLHSPLAQGLIGAVIISGFFGLQYYISKGRWIGFGDVKLGLFLGLIFGLGQSLILLMFSYLTGAIVGVSLIGLGRKELGSKLPFGTFLSFCGIIMLIYGKSILAYYLQIIGF